MVFVMTAPISGRAIFGDGWDVTLPYTADFRGSLAYNIDHFCAIFGRIFGVLDVRSRAQRAHFR